MCVYVHTVETNLLQSSFRSISSFCTLFILTELFCSIWEDQFRQRKFPAKTNIQVSSMFLNSSNITTTQRLHTDCSTLFLGWLPAAVRHMAPSSWGVYFAIRTCKVFPSAGRRLEGSAPEPELLSILQKCAFHTGFRLGPAEFSQQKRCVSFLKRISKREAKWTQELCR